MHKTFPFIAANSIVSCSHPSVMFIQILERIFTGAKLGHHKFSFTILFYLNILDLNNQNIKKRRLRDGVIYVKLFQISFKSQFHKTSTMSTMDKVYNLSVPSLVPQQLQMSTGSRSETVHQQLSEPQLWIIPNTQVFPSTIHH